MNAAMNHKSEYLPKAGHNPTARVMAEKGCFFMQKNTKRTIIALVALCVLVIGLFTVYQFLRPKATQGAKTINIEIIVNDKTVAAYELNTDAEYLRQALEEKNLIKGDESAFGLYVKTVDGISADENNQEWWCFTKGGEQMMTGVDDTPINDGDSYEITFMVGYDV